MSRIQWCYLQMQGVCFSKDASTVLRALPEDVDAVYQLPASPLQDSTKALQRDEFAPPFPCMPSLP